MKIRVLNLCHVKQNINKVKIDKCRHITMKPISKYVEYMPSKNINVSIILFKYISFNVSASERLSKKGFS